MLMCPFCRAEVPDDSRFCDQCGKEFMFCPECGRPKRGTMCAACGVDLIKADVFFGAASKPAVPPPPTVTIAPAPVISAPAGTSLVGEGLTLPLTEGDFGRRGGIWPAFSAFPYISGLHGHIGRQGASWTITDLGSTNGTKVNGKSLARGVACPFKAGDTIEIATSKFVVK